MTNPHFHILDSIFDTLSSGMLLFEADGTIIRMNLKAKEILGLDSEIQPSSLNDHLPFYLSPLVSLLEGATQDIHRGEIALNLPCREEESTIGYNLKHLASGDKTVKALTFSDITQVHKDRLSMDKIKDELNQSKKLASIGTMIAGVAHEMNNPITGISMSASLITMNLERLKKQPELLALPKVTDSLDKALLELGKIAKASEKAGVLVNDLLAYSKPTQLYLLPIPLRDLVQDTVKALKSHPQFSRFTLQIQGDTPRAVLCDRVKLEQVFYNLLKNACDATDGQGTLTIFYREHEESDGKIFITTHVKDNGPGIDKTIINRIFDPFFTTKGHSGVGLGLSISYRTVEQHGGLLSVESTKGEGTEFKVALPIYQAPADSSNNDETTSKPKAPHA